MTRILMSLILAGTLGLARLGFGDDAPVSAGMLNQAYDLVHQAWNPDGDPPSAADRTTLLTKALKLTQEAPDHHLRGTRVAAARDIRAALDALKAGQSDHAVTELIHTASEDLRTALSLSQ